jgi:hypothetical protein
MSSIKGIVALIFKLTIMAFMIGAMLLAFFTMFTTDQVSTVGSWVFQGFGDLYTEVLNRTNLG